METDKHYFIEGLFVIGLALAAALFFVWLTGSGHRDDVLYRIRFAESVSGRKRHANHEPRFRTKQASAAVADLPLQ